MQFEEKVEEFEDRIKMDDDWLAVPVVIGVRRRLKKVCFTIVLLKKSSSLLKFDWFYR